MSNFHSIQLSVEAITMPDGQPMPNAEVVLYRNFFKPLESDCFLQELFSEIDWQQDWVKIQDREINVPRLTAWYGDAGKSYTYSAITKHPHPWSPTLLTIKKAVEEVSQVEFNSVLLNFYRSGKDRVSWHSDDEPELGKNPLIASVSLGAARRFQLRHKFDKNLDKVAISLSHGSLLIMKGATQHFWQHQVPEASKSLKERINLTFRVIY